MTHIRGGVLILMMLMAGLLGGLVISGRLSLTTGSDAAPQAPPAIPAPEPPAARPTVVGPLPDLSSIAEAALKVSANISSTTIVRIAQDPFWEFFNGNQVRPSQSLGSGVVVSADGYVLTNTHVIGGNAGARPDVRVTLSDGRERPAKLIGTDEISDLAVVKVDATQLPTLPWGDSEKLRVAEWVLAIGNPYQLSGTVTLGIVSTVSRSGEQVGAVQDFIQTDAAINRGNSGGALINARGELVGINTLIFSESGGSQGIGFAIPSNRARKIMDELIAHGAVAWGSIGNLELFMVDERVARQYGLAATGALVRSIGRNAPAYAAGIQPGDILRTINGQAISSPEQVERIVIRQRVGSTIPFDVVKSDGRRARIEVPVVDRREQQLPRRR
jgi:S1-C subfamily serine protease